VRSLLWRLRTCLTRVVTIVISYARHAKHCLRLSETWITTNPAQEARRLAGDSLLDHIFCRYCRKHWEDTILHPNYERTGCPPRISDEERDNLRKERASTAPYLEGTDNYFDYFESGRAHSAKPAHSPICPGFNEMGVEGFCTFDRHILNASEAPGSLEDGDPNEITAARVVTPRKTKASFTNAHVVSTSTTYGRNYAPPRGDSRGDTDYDGEGDGSSVGSGHHSDPTEFDEDDSDPSCGPTCRCEKC
jgi:hypothetical protein